MGSCWSMYKFSGNLKQPYRCIVHCGSNIFKAGLVLLIAGFILIYFFWNELHGVSFWKRAVAVTGVVFVSVALVLVTFAIIVCVFYIRLYKSNEDHLQEISVQNLPSRSPSTWPPVNYSERNSPPIWHSQQSPYIFTPSAPPASSQQSSGRTDMYRAPPWSSFMSGSPVNSERHSSDGKNQSLSESPKPVRMK